MAERQDDLIPLRRPHFELRGERLFFLISERPHAALDEVDRTLWQRIDGAASVSQLQSSTPDADARLHRFHQLAICELAAPRFPVNRRRVLVIEPHMDDAVLSVGGSMWTLRNDCEFTVVTLAGRSNYTSYFELDREYFDVATVSALRQAESGLAMRLLGGRHHALDLPEAPLRFHPAKWTLDWYRRHRKQVEAFLAHAPGDHEIDAWTNAVATVLSTTDAQEIWLPLGVGSHTDHELARTACLRALSRIERRPEAAISFYQDVPYATQFPEHTDAILAAMTAAGGRLTSKPIDVSQSFPDKLRLVSVFASQFKPDHMNPRVERAARRAGPAGDGLHELLFPASTLPGAVDAIAASSERDEVERLAPALARWYARHRLADRIRLLSPVPISRWRDDVSRLLDAFPGATLEIHVSGEYADETGSLVSPRVEVRPVIGRETAWVARLVSLAIEPPCPTVLLTGEGLRPFAPLASAVFPLSDVVATIRMNHLVLALRRITSS
jgi:LmbE family N-acetylglucosaminyl deacetylase